ncbi:MAG: hypothetical protein Q9199_007955 [Rusavskia elegans]
MLRFAAFQDDSFLPGYKELTFVFPDENLVSYRVVPDSDPRLANLVTFKSLAESLLTDVRRRWTDRSLTDDAILQRVNALSHRSDAVWWGSIVQHRLQARAKSEGEKVSRQFQNANRMDQETAKRMAELINTEQMDLVTFEATAGEPNDSGKRPTLQAIQERRQAMQNEARENLKTELAQDESDHFHAMLDAAPMETVDIPRGSCEEQPMETIKPEESVSPDIADQEPAPDASSLPVDGGSVISSSEQNSSIHNGPYGRGPQPSATTPQASHMTTQDSSSPITPIQASFNASFAPAPVRPAMNHRGLWQNLKWAYLTHTRADIELQSKGIWLFEKPLTCTREVRSNDLSGLQLQPSCPMVISSDFEDRSEPYLEYNDIALTMYTHLPPWTNDHRSIENFAGLVPDFQSEVPLAEYQTLEALGSHVWRHDRDLLPCRGPDCKKMLSDMAKTTLICLGCGPKSIVRFCSVRCHLASLRKHVQECWNPQLLINKLIDENSSPPRFSHLAPSLRDRHGYRTYQNYRQRVAAQYSGGRYSLFNPLTEEATILTWDKRFSRNRHPELPYPGYTTEMESRIERCLNIALFDHTNTPIIEHLYRLLQLCLQGKNAWNPALAAVLTRQFLLEFDYDVHTSLRIQASA